MGLEYAGSTELQATDENRKAAERFEKRQRQMVLSSRAVERAKDFATAAGEFIAWCKDVEYRQKQNTAKRIETSFASLLAFFSDTSVSAIGPGEVEHYKTHRIQVNRVRDVTLRHDLHALSLFFQYAEKMRWRQGNPVRQVTIPSDRESVRMHVVTDEEEKKYFAAALEVVDSAGQRNLYDVATIMLNQGCRPEEIMSARKCDLGSRGVHANDPGWQESCGATCSAPNTPKPRDSYGTTEYHRSVVVSVGTVSGESRHQVEQQPRPGLHRCRCFFRTLRSALYIRHAAGDRVENGPFHSCCHHGAQQPPNDNAIRSSRPEGAKRGNGTLRNCYDAAEAEAGQMKPMLPASWIDDSSIRAPARFPRFVRRLAPFCPSGSGQNCMISTDVA